MFDERDEERGKEEAITHLQITVRKEEIPNDKGVVYKVPRQCTIGELKEIICQDNGPAPQQITLYSTVDEVPCVPRHEERFVGPEIFAMNSQIPIFYVVHEDFFGPEDDCDPPPRPKKKKFVAKDEDAEAEAKDDDVKAEAEGEAEAEAKDEDAKAEAKDEDAKAEAEGETEVEAEGEAEAKAEGEAEAKDEDAKAEAKAEAKEEGKKGAGAEEQERK